MRHGKGFLGWWKQERKDQMVSQSVVAENLFEKLNMQQRITIFHNVPACM